MTHHHLRLQGTNGFQSHTNNDQYGRTAHCQRAQVLVCHNQENRHNGDDTEEERAHQSDLGQNTLNVIRSRLARTDTRDAAVALAQVVAISMGLYCIDT